MRLQRPSYPRVGAMEKPHPGNTFDQQPPVQRTLPRLSWLSVSRRSGGRWGLGGGEGGQPACSERTSSNTRSGHQDSGCLTKSFYKALQSSPLLTKPSFRLCSHSTRSAPSSEGSPAPSPFCFTDATSSEFELLTLSWH